MAKMACAPAGWLRGKLFHHGLAASRPDPAETASFPSKSPAGPQEGFLGLSGRGGGWGGGGQQGVTCHLRASWKPSPWPYVHDSEPACRRVVSETVLCGQIHAIFYFFQN